MTTNYARKPDRAYRGADLWLPKSQINVKAVQGSLTFQPAKGGKLLAYQDTQHHLVVPRHFVPVEDLEDLPYPLEHVPPPKFPRLPEGLRARSVLRQPEDGRTNQVAMWKALTEGGDGVLVLKCGGGKTVVAAHSAISLGYPTLFVGHNGSILDQWKERLQQHTTISADGIGMIGDGKMDWEKPFCVASIQTLWQKIEEGELPPEMANHFGTMVFDEVHHMAAEKFNLAANLCHGVRWGLTATPRRDDGMDALYQMNIGPVLYRDLDQDLTPDAFFIRTGKQLTGPEIEACRDARGQFSIGKFHATLLSDPQRDDILAEYVNRALDDGREVLVLTPTRDHLDVLARRWSGPDVGVVHGDTKQSDRTDIVRKCKLLLSIEELGIEALDKPSLSVVILACPMKSRNNLQQILGRIQRAVPGKPQPILLVLTDDAIRKSAEWSRRMQSTLATWGVPFSLIDP